jgi:hypothetical protein
VQTPQQQQQHRQRQSSLFQQSRTLGEPQLHEAIEQALQTPVQQQPRQAKGRVVWGYLDGDNADEWTWDDDYNPDAIVSLVKPSPLKITLARVPASASRQPPIAASSSTFLQSIVPSISTRH